MEIEEENIWKKKKKEELVENQLYQNSWFIGFKRQSSSPDPVKECSTIVIVFVSHHKSCYVINLFS